METPSGYKELGLAGYTDKGTYSSSATYVKNDLVHDDNNSIWKCLIDDTTGIEPAAGDNWELFIKGFKNASKLPATDTEGLAGTAGEETDTQTLLNKLAALLNPVKPSASNTSATDTNGLFGTAGAAKTAQAIFDEIVRRINLFSNAETYIRHDITSRIKELPAAIKSGHPELYGFHEGDYFTGASGYTYTLVSYCHIFGAYDNYAVRATRSWRVLVNTHATHAWNSSGKTTGGYSASELDAYLNGDVLTTVKSDITTLMGEDWSKHLLASNRLLSNAINATGYNRLGAASGCSSNFTWFADRYIVAPSEIEMYGSIVWSSSGYDTGEANKPLKAMQKFRFNEILGNIYVWLRDIVSESYAAFANDLGDASVDGAQDASYVVGLIDLY